MPTLNPIKHEIPAVVPSGSLRHLSTDEIKPSANNPRHLFDDSPMRELKKNIAEHGVLVPITVYRAKGERKFSILDGERRHRCVVELTADGVLGPNREPLKLPANIVDPPTRIAGLLYMFSIHNFRQGWELMPTALALKTVMDEIGEEDGGALSKLTGLSPVQIERCKLLIRIPKHFQELSLDPDPKTRIPSNFWIEAAPLVDVAQELPELKPLGRTRLMEKLVDKYRAKKIKSVIHFRRPMNALDLTEDDPELRQKVLLRIVEFFLRPDMELRTAFEEFILERQRVQSALQVCDDFMDRIGRLRLRYTPDKSDRTDLMATLRRVREYCEGLEHKLEGTDDPSLRDDD